MLGLRHILLFALLVLTGAAAGPGAVWANEIDGGWRDRPAPDGYLMAQASSPGAQEEDAAPAFMEEPEDKGFSDPLEPWNRAMFVFNDKFYLWLLIPVADGYRWVFPQDIRMAVRNFFVNLFTPIRAVNLLLQGNLQGFGRETAAFFINSTVGLGGLGNPAEAALGLRPQLQDLGLTLGSYGVGPGVYINWPILGPSSVRDTFGMVGDTFLNPLYYLSNGTVYTIGGRSYELLNRTSFATDEYEKLKAAALDPYVAFRNGYYQFREGRVAGIIADRAASGDAP